MKFPHDQILDLKRISAGLEYFEEANEPYLLLRDYLLPSGVEPSQCDLVLCPHPRDGYPSRLYFSRKVACSPNAKCTTALNWNGSARLLERDWSAYSWRVEGGPYTLIQLLALHLKALQ